MQRGLQLFVSVGFLGGLTTFSSVSVESVRLIQSGALLLFVSYQLLSLLGGALMVALGMALAHRLGRLFSPQQRP
jgi:CrcB protein